jgi:hypothetical protein
MLTFEQIGDEVAAQVEDDSATTRTLIDRAINQGMQKFGAILNREWRNDEVIFSTVANQQYYQMPESGIRVKTIVITIGGVAYPLIEISDRDTWNELNRRTETSDVPEFYHVKGADQFGIWPTPSSSTSDAGRLMFEARMRRMSQNDYTTGTISVTNSSVAIVGAGTTFTAQMVGRTLLIEDAGDQDGIGYKVSAFTDTTNFSVENKYGGLSGSGKSYRIGEVPDLPEEYHESLVDYGCYRVYRRRRDRGLAADAKAAFDESIAQCEASYSSMSASQYSRAVRISGALYRRSRRDYRVTGG